MLSRFLPAGLAAVALAAALPAHAESAGLIPPKKPDFGALKPAAETRKTPAAKTAAVDLRTLDPAKADSAKTDAATAPGPVAGDTAAAPEPASPKDEKKKRHRGRAAKASTEPAPAETQPAPAPQAPGLIGALAALSAQPPATAQPQTPANALPSLFRTSDAGTASAPIGRSQLNALIAHHARINNVPESLVHRIVIRESKYNPRAVGRGGAMGLMQIKTATARGVGYQGGPGGLLDAETNLTYGVKYLAGAWRVSGGSQDRAVGHYARGYYYEAKRMGLHGPTRWSRRGRQDAPPALAQTPAQGPTLFSFFSQ